jgi:hypothetical protein
MAKKQTKSNNIHTVKDLKMWLRGMAEFQEADWTPSPKQWKTILETIESLEDNVQYVQQVTEPQRMVAPSPSPAPPAYFHNETQGGAVVQPSAQRFLESDDGLRNQSQYNGGSAPHRPIATGSGILDTDINKSFI